MTVQQVVLADCLHPVAPPEKVLRIGAVGDTAFLYFETYEETAKGCLTTIREEIAVSLPALRQALQLLRDDLEREDHRPADGEHGERKAKLDGPRAGVHPL